MASPGTIVPARAEQLTEESASKKEDSPGAIVPARAKQLTEEISQQDTDLKKECQKHTKKNTVIQRFV